MEANSNNIKWSKERYTINDLLKKFTNGQLPRILRVEKDCNDEHRTVHLRRGDILTVRGTHSLQCVSAEFQCALGNIHSLSIPLSYGASLRKLSKAEYVFPTVVDLLKWSPKKVKVTFCPPGGPKVAKLVQEGDELELVGPDRNRKLLVCTLRGKEIRLPLGYRGDFEDVSDAFVQDLEQAITKCLCPFWVSFINRQNAKHDFRCIKYFEGDVKLKHLFKQTLLVCKLQGDQGEYVTVPRVHRGGEEATWFALPEHPTQYCESAAEYRPDPCTPDKTIAMVNFVSRTHMKAVLNDSRTPTPKIKPPIAPKPKPAVPPRLKAHSSTTQEREKLRIESKYHSEKSADNYVIIVSDDSSETTSSCRSVASLGKVAPSPPDSPVSSTSTLVPPGGRHSPPVPVSGKPQSTSSNSISGLPVPTALNEEELCLIIPAPKPAEVNASHYDNLSTLESPPHKGYICMDGTNGRGNYQNIESPPPRKSPLLSKSPLSMSPLRGDSSYLQLPGKDDYVPMCLSPADATPRNKNIKSPPPRKSPLISKSPLRTSPPRGDSSFLQLPGMDDYVPMCLSPADATPKNDLNSKLESNHKRDSAKSPSVSTSSSRKPHSPPPSPQTKAKVLQNQANVVWAQEDTSVQKQHCNHLTPASGLPLVPGKPLPPPLTEVRPKTLGAGTTGPPWTTTGEVSPSDSSTVKSPVPTGSLHRLVVSKVNSLEEIPDDLTQLTVEGLACTFHLLKLSEIADVCVKELVDGPIFTELTEDDLQQEPFNLSGLKLRKTLSLKNKGWRPLLDKSGGH